VIFCRSCDIALASDARHCPRCGRDLRVRLRRTLLFAGAVFFGLILGIGLWKSGSIKARVQHWETSDAEVLKAAQQLVSTNAAVRNPGGFSGIDQTTVEHWDGRRWRVSGYVDTQPEPGLKLRTLYFVVLVNNGTNWHLEDLQLQSMDSGSGKAHAK
jgi:hypothetical protein